MRLIMLLAFLAGCSFNPDRYAVYVSTHERNRDMGGTEENYEPKRMRGELVDENNNLTYAQIGEDDNETDYELGIGKILRFSHLYGKAGLGIGYVTDELEQHDYKLNFHFSAGLGFEIPATENCALGIERSYDHLSVGKGYNPLVNGKSKNKNHGINFKGWAGGLICKI